VVRVLLHVGLQVLPAFRQAGEKPPDVVLGSRLAEQAGDPLREGDALAGQRPVHVHQDRGGRFGVRAVGCEGRGDNGQQAAGKAAGNPDAQPAYGFQRLPRGIRAPASRSPWFFGDVQQCRHGPGDLLVRDELGLRANDLRGCRHRAAERQGEEVPHVCELAEAGRVPGCLLALSCCGKDLHCGCGLVGIGEHVAEQPQVDHFLAQVPCQAGLPQAPPRVLEGIGKVAVVGGLERGQCRLAGPGEQPFLVRDPLGYLGEVGELGRGQLVQGTRAGLHRGDLVLGPLERCPLIAEARGDPRGASSAELIERGPGFGQRTRPVGALLAMRCSAPIPGLVGGSRPAPGSELRAQGG
jgi:hypothetical protein